MENEVKNGLDTRQTYEPEDLYSSVEALVGGKIEAFATMKAEMKRQAEDYVILHVKNGRETYRVILQVVEVHRPMPASKEMWDLMDSGFWTPEEIRARDRFMPLALPDWGEDEEEVVEPAEPAVVAQEGETLEESQS